MTVEQNWHTEYYKGMNVYVSALPKDETRRNWDYTVRITEPGTDGGAESELVARSGDDDDFPSESEAVQAGFVKGYAMVDESIK